MAPGEGARTAAETAPEAAAAAAAAPEDPLARFSEVSVRISVEARIVGLTVRELFRLEKGSIVTTSSSANASLPLYVGKKMIAWCEFQVADEKLGVRVAELA
jgi:flagellar motor switch/type III secretory pathway protein FliN